MLIMTKKTHPTTLQHTQKFILHFSCVRNHNLIFALPSEIKQPDYLGQTLAPPTYLLNLGQNLSQQSCSNTDRYFVHICIVPPTTGLTERRHRFLRANILWQYNTEPRLAIALCSLHYSENSQV